jgi:hypothetical protein
MELSTLSTLMHGSKACRSFGSNYIYMGHGLVQLVEALHYKPEGRGFDSR